MEKDWTTVKGRKYTKNTKPNPNLKWKQLEPTILTNINTIVKSELLQLSPYTNPFKNNIDCNLTVEYHNISDK